MALLRGLGLEANAANDSATLPTYTGCRRTTTGASLLDHSVVALLRELGLVADVTSPKLEEQALQSMLLMHSICCCRRKH